jgi:hypothetical protein
MDKEDLELLNAVFDASADAATGVNRLSFRARHPKHLSRLDRMERTGRLQARSTQYFVSVTALRHCANPRAAQLLESAEPIFQYLQEQYVLDQQRVVPLTEIVHHTGLTIERVRCALHYMVEGMWWGGQSLSLEEDSAYVMASERALGFESFRSVIDQLKSWQEERELAWLTSASSAPVAASSARSGAQNIGNGRIQHSPQLLASFRYGQPSGLEESGNTELKEVNSADPVRAIANTADEYAVAFLNGTGGSIYWGFRDSDTVPVGVRLTQVDRDRLRRAVFDKLNSIQPQIDPTRFEFDLQPLANADAVDGGDLYVIRLDVPSGDGTDPYFTSGHEAFVRLNGVNKRLTGPQLTNWIRRRAAPSPTASNGPAIVDDATAAFLARFRSLLANHGLAPAHFSRFLRELKAPFTCTLADLYTDTALMAWLDEDKLTWLIEVFRVRREWLDGEDPYIYAYSHYDKQPRKFWRDVSAATKRFNQNERLGFSFAHFIRAGKGKDWARKGDKHVYVVVAVPIAALSTERTIYQYLSDFSPYPWDYPRTHIQLRAWARLLSKAGFVITGKELKYDVSERLGANELFLWPLFESPGQAITNVDWHLDDYALGPEESCASKDSARLPEVLTFLRENGLPA